MEIPYSDSAKNTIFIFRKKINFFLTKLIVFDIVILLMLEN